MQKISRMVALLNGQDLTPRNPLEKAVKTLVAKIGKGGGGGAALPDVSAADNGKLLGVENGEWGKVAAPNAPLFVPFTVSGSGASTTADFSEVLAEVQAGKHVVAEVTSGGMIVRGELRYLYPDVDPNILGFCVVVDHAAPGDAADPEVFKISWSASGVAASITKLSVST